MNREKLWAAPVTSLASQSVCVWKGSSEEMRHTYMKSAQEGGTLICHTKPAESECSVQRRERAAYLPPHHLHCQSPTPTPWHLHVLFMPSIFRIIPNLIAVSLLLPAAAAPKIKSCPRKGMLG